MIGDTNLYPDLVNRSGQFHTPVEVGCYLFTLVNMLHRDNHCLSVTMNRDLPEVGNGVQLFDHGSPGKDTK